MMSDTAYMYFTVPGDTVTYQTVYVKEQSGASLPHADQVIVAQDVLCVPVQCCREGNDLHDHGTNALVF